MVTLTTEEFDKLSPDERKAHFADEEKTVFGRTKADEPSFKRAKGGKPIEQGVGAKGLENGNHFAGIRKYEGEDAYWEAVAEIWKRDPARAEKLNLPKPKAKAA